MNCICGSPYNRFVRFNPPQYSCPPDYITPGISLGVACCSVGHMISQQVHPITPIQYIHHQHLVPVYHVMRIQLSHSMLIHGAEVPSCNRIITYWKSVVLCVLTSANGILSRSELIR